MNTLRIKRIKLFKNSSINPSLVNGGDKRTYSVFDIVFDHTPITLFFTTKNAEKISIADYFEKVYKMKITDPKQPLFLIRNNG
jgi:hypothetical protein